MRVRIRWSLRLVMVALVVQVMGGCVQPRPPQLPDVDIVFQLYPVVGYDQSTALGFINADGTGFVEMEIVKETGGLPTWSADGEMIFYRWWPPGTMHSSTGRADVATAGLSNCQETDLWAAGRPRQAPGKGNTIVTVLSIGNTPPEYNIGIVNPVECEVVETILDIGFLEGESPCNPALSIDGLLALDFFRPRAESGAESSLAVIDLDTGEEFHLGEGVGPSWSPDGQWLAFTKRDGIYISQNDGSDLKLVYAYRSDALSAPVPSHGNVWRDWPPHPEWSPDGRFLIFHLYEQGSYNLHLLDLDTGKDQVLFEGGLYPHWRLTPNSAADESS